MRGKFRLGRPSPAMIIAIVALVAALTGTAYAAKLGLGALSGKAKDKTIGVGKLTYVNTTQTVVPNPSTTAVDATITSPCPGGLKAIGGSTKSPSNTGAPTGGFALAQQYPTSGGWTSQVFVGGPSEVITVTAICAASRKVSGAPPAITP
jgi:hypothetical protein